MPQTSFWRIRKETTHNIMIQYDTSKDAACEQSTLCSEAWGPSGPLILHLTTAAFPLMGTGPPTRAVSWSFQTVLLEATQGGIYPTPEMCISYRVSKMFCPEQFANCNNELETMALYHQSVSTPRQT